MDNVSTDIGPQSWWTASHATDIDPQSASHATDIDATVPTVPTAVVPVPRPRGKRSRVIVPPVPAPAMSAAGAARLRTAFGPGMSAVMSACATIRTHAVMTESAIAADITAVRAAVARAIPTIAVGAGGANTAVFGTIPGIAQYQNQLFRANADPSARFTDRVLIVMWAVPFPAARCAYAAHPDYVGSTRSLFNAGRHANAVPDAPSVAYAVDGTPAVGHRRIVRAATA